MKKSHKNELDDLAQGPAAGPPEPGRRARRAAETRLNLFRCALQLFAQRGYANVTVEEITEAADVGKGTFFNYFASKEHVLAVMAEVQVGKVERAHADVFERELPVPEALHSLMHRLAEEPGRSPALACAFLSSFLASEGVRGIVAEHMRQGRAQIAEMVAVGQERGEIAAHLKKEKVAMHLLQTCMGTVLLWSLDGKSSLKSRMEASYQHFWRAIAATRRERKS